MVGGAGGGEEEEEGKEGDSISHAPITGPRPCKEEQSVTFDCCDNIIFSPSSRHSSLYTCRQAIDSGDIFRAQTPCVVISHFSTLKDTQR